MKKYIIIKVLERGEKKKGSRSGGTGHPNPIPWNC
jgi:hypothetical protein